MTRLLEAMRLARKQPHLDRHMVLFQSHVQLPGLSRRHSLVSRSMLDKGWSAGLLDECHGGGPTIGFELIPWLAPEITVEDTLKVVGRIHREHVRESRADHHRLEPVGLCEGPGRHISAVAPSGLGEFVGIGSPGCYERIDPALNVLVIATAPVLEVGEEESFAVAR